MAEKIYFLDVSGGAPEYDSADQAQRDEAVDGDEILYNFKNQLEVAHVSVLQISIDSGGQVSNGRMYMQTEAADGADPKLLNADAATTGYLRKDRVVVKFDISNANANAVLIKGVEASFNPALPNIPADTATVWYRSLAILNIESGSITSVEDDRAIGNSRFNPVLATQMSAPDLILREGGKIGLADAGDAKDIDIENVKNWIRRSNGKLLYQEDGCTEVQLVPMIYDTADAPTSGTYPAGTVHLKHDV